MTREQAVTNAIEFHNARCRARTRFWMGETKQEPDDANWGFKHGWFTMDGHSVGPHEYAPGPTYNED